MYNKPFIPPSQTWLRIEFKFNGFDHHHRCRRRRCRRRHHHQYHQQHHRHHNSLRCHHRSHHHDKRPIISATFDVFRHTAINSISTFTEPWGSETPPAGQVPFLSPQRLQYLTKYIFARDKSLKVCLFIPWRATEVVKMFVCRASYHGWLVVSSDAWMFGWVHNTGELSVRSLGSYLG